MKRLSTVEMLAWATIIALCATVAVYCCPRVPADLKTLLSSLLSAYSGALLAALRAGATSQGDQDADDLKKSAERAAGEQSQ